MDGKEVFVRIVRKHIGTAQYAGIGVVRGQAAGAVKKIEQNKHTHAGAHNGQRAVVEGEEFD